ncbi:hypothetical protein BB560_000190 [Smittium megazygosporum]|uniref:Uncharacterized protein n=1 Tax=Smittium megazygosporum TaxID=133381 RepID=A0A2T9ZL48_9FUNG|nr:hypothetical protein BB560_000190 [Smittium megazygosporum]
MQKEPKPSWVDYTILLFKAASDLPSGKMIKRDEFTLKDTMNALEIMDPIMDTGYSSSGDLSEIASIQKELTPEEAFASQNLFRDYIVLPIQISAVKCAEIVTSEIKKRNVYPEEDFYFEHYDSSFWNEVSAQDSIQLLENSIWVLQNHKDDFYRFYLEQKKNSLADSLEQTDQSTDLYKQFLAIFDELLIRLNFRFHFLHTLTFLSEITSEPVEYLRLFNSHLEFSKKYFSLNKAFYSSKKNTLAADVSKFFDKNIVRTVSNVGPMKKLDSPDISITLDLFEKLLNELGLVNQFCTSSSVQEILWFSFVHGQQRPCLFPYVRSLIQSILFHNNLFFIRYSKHRFVENYISLTVGPLALSIADGISSTFSPKPHPAASTNIPKSMIKAKIFDFLSSIQDTLVNVFRSYYHNHPRQRRIQSRLLFDLDCFQKNAEEIDYLLNSYLSNFDEIDQFYQKSSFQGSNVFFFTEFIICIKFDLMSYINTLGISEKIFQLYEYPIIYWHLNKIYSTHYRILDNLNKFDQAIEENVPKMNLFKLTKKENYPENNGFASNCFTLEYPLQANLGKLSFSSHKTLLLEGQRLLSLGQHVTFTCIYSLGLITTPWDFQIIKSLDKLVNLTLDESIASNSSSKSNVDIMSLLEKYGISSNILENIKNSKLQRNPSNTESRFKLRFTNYTNIKAPLQCEYTDWTRYYNDVLSVLSIRKSLSLAQESFSNARKIFDALKKNLVFSDISQTSRGSNDSPTKNAFIGYIDELLKTCLHNSITVMKFLNGAYSTPNVIDVFSYSHKEINESISDLCNKVLEIGDIGAKVNKKDNSSSPALNSLNEKDEISEFSKVSLNKKTSIKSKKKSKSRKKHLVNANVPTSILPFQTVLKQLADQVLNKWEFSLDFKYNRMWPCIVLCPRSFSL